jgi:hypothetical protein
VGESLPQSGAKAGCVPKRRCDSAATIDILEASPHNSNMLDSDQYFAWRKSSGRKNKRGEALAKIRQGLVFPCSVKGSAWQGQSEPHSCIPCRSKDSTVHGRALEIARS